MTKTYQDAFGMKVDEIKRLLKENPGLMIHSERRTGKSTALMQHIREQHAGAVAVVCPNGRQAEEFRYRYREMYPMEVAPFVLGPTEIHDLDGRDLPIYADEWPSLSDRAKSELRRRGIRGAVGMIEGPSILLM